MPYGNVASIAGLIFLISELGLALAKRARRGEAQVQDRGSLGLLWAVIVVSVFLSYNLAYNARDLSFGLSAAAVTGPLGILCVAGGLLLRWYAILSLGRYFTVDVAIAADQRVIDAGPYRYIRHPSYAGALLGFLGIGLLLNNAAALLLIVVAPLLVFLRRIHIEEAVLLKALGEAYHTYMHRTRRLIPGLY